MMDDGEAIIYVSDKLTAGGRIARSRPSRPSTD